MGRPRSFDINEVVALAKEVFWEKGYADTSISDLEEATSLRRTSLYAAFGDKDGIYRAALSQYREQAHSQLDALLNSTTDQFGSLRQFFLILAEQNVKCSKKKGCLINNATSEFGSRCDRTTALAVSNRNDLISKFEKSIIAGKKTGQIAEDVDAAASASYLHTIQCGIVMAAKQGASTEELHRTIHTAFDTVAGK